jgi:tetrahydromethanopterin S-methyltransferase subunit G
MEANCQKHSAEIEALKENNSRIMERLDRFEEKVDKKFDELKTALTAFTNSAPAMFASREEFEKQKLELEGVKGAFKAFMWIVMGGGAAIGAFLKFVLKVF